MSEDTKVDLFRIYIGDPYEVTEKIKIYQPTLRDVADFGESDFWSFVVRFAGNPTTMRVALWDSGVDWCKIKDYDLFVSLIPTFTLDRTCLFFGDLDFTRFYPVYTEREEVKNDKTVTVRDCTLIHLDDPDIILNEEIYWKMMRGIRTILDFHPRNHYGKGKTTRQVIIDGDKADAAFKAKQNKDKAFEESDLVRQVSFVLNSSGFTGTLDDIMSMTYFQFTDCVNRLQATEHTIALLHGINVGMIDTKEIKGLDKKLDLVKSLY